MAHNRLILKAANDVLNTINEYYEITKNLYGGAPNVNYETFTEGLDKPEPAMPKKTQTNTSNVAQTTVEQAAQEALDSIDNLEQTQTAGQKLRSGVNKLLQGAGKTAKRIGHAAKHGMHHAAELAHRGLEAIDIPHTHLGIEEGVHNLLHNFAHSGAGHAVANAGHGAVQHASTVGNSNEMLPQVVQYLAQVAPHLLDKLPQYMQMVMVPGATQ